MNVTKRNHYNPCFWTAHWNSEYYRCAVHVEGDLPPARQQKVWALSVKSGRMFETTVDNVHFDKGLGIAEISREAAEDFARRHHPDRYEQFLSDNATAPYPVFLDFEPILVAMEDMPPYKVLLDVIKRQSVESAIEKSFLGCFVFLQLLRSHAMMNSMIEWHRELRREKFEALVTLKWMISDFKAMCEAVVPLVMSHWTLFVSASPTYPLCDSPVLVQPNSVMLALSPTLLLEILPRVPAGEHQCSLQEAIPKDKLTTFMRRTIGNTFREIIFGERDLLERWKATAEFEDRVALMKDTKSYNRLVESRGNEELWLVNAYGNRL